MLRIFDDDNAKCLKEMKYLIGEEMKMFTDVNAKQTIF